MFGRACAPMHCKLRHSWIEHSTIDQGANFHFLERFHNLSKTLKAMVLSCSNNAKNAELLYALSAWMY